MIIFFIFVYFGDILPVPGLMYTRICEADLADAPVAKAVSNKVAAAAFSILIRILYWFIC